MQRISGLLLVCALLLPTIGQAQFNALTSEVSLEVRPKIPEPNSTVTVTINDYALSGGSGDVRWFRDGEAVAGAANARSIEVPVGAVGEPTTIEARIGRTTGDVRVAETTITPAQVAIILEPQTTAPTWYLGRSLPSVGSDVRAVAFPQTGDDLSPEDYTYTWRLNGSTLRGGGVRGQQATLFTMPFGGDTILGVTIARPDGVVVAERSVVVPAVEPELQFYGRNALRGMSRLAQPASFQLLGTELTLVAEPFHLATNVTADNSVFEWTINNRTIANPSQDPYQITLRNDGGTGQFNVSFHVRNLEQLLQGAEQSFSVSF